MTVKDFPVERGPIALFARAIGDTNPVYSDAEYAAATEVEGIIAPPTFVQSGAHFDPDYPLRPKAGEKWFGSGRNPSGVDRSGGSGGGLHAEQEFTYHRHLRPGDVLSATVRPGQEWERDGRSGKLRFSESITEYRDQQGNLVVTARSVGVRTERQAGAS